MRIAVTGANGFVGQRLCNYLEQQGDTVHRIVRRKDPEDNHPYTRIIDNFFNPKEIAEALRGCDYVIHLIAKTHHTSKATTAEALNDYTQTNVDISDNIARAAVAAGIRRLVYLSSIKVLGNQSCAPFCLATPPHPDDIYGETKLAAENKITEICANTDTEWTILRPPLVYAPNAKGNLASLRKLIHHHIPLPFGQLANRRSLIDLDRLCFFLRAGCISEAAAFQRIPVTNPLPISTPQLIKQIASDMNHSAHLLPFPPAILRLLGKIPPLQASIARLTGDLEVDPQPCHRMLGVPDAQ